MMTRRLYSKRHEQYLAVMTQTLYSERHDTDIRTRPSSVDSDITVWTTCKKRTLPSSDDTDIV